MVYFIECCARKAKREDLVYEDQRNGWGRHGKGENDCNKGRKRRIPPCRGGGIAGILGIRGRLRPKDAQYQWDPDPKE